MPDSKDKPPIAWLKKWLSLAISSTMKRSQLPIYLAHEQQHPQTRIDIDSSILLQLYYEPTT